MNPDQTNSTNPTPVPEPVPTPIATPTPAFQEVNSSSSTPPADPPQPTVIASDSSSKPPFPKKALIAGLTILTLIAGIVTSVLLVNRQARLQTSAWDCGKYSFNVSVTGEVTARNQSDRDEPAQNVSIEITPTGGTKTTRLFNVPALKKGENANLGTVSVPNGGGFAWNAVGSSDCKNSGVYAAVNSPTPQSCVPYSVEVNPTSGDWNHPDKFSFKNITNQPLTFTYDLDCWEKGEKSGVCKDKTVSVTLQPGETKTDGFGKICSKWQFDLKSVPNCANKGFIAEETCSSPTATPRASSTPTPSPRASATPTPRPSATPTPTVGPSSTPGTTITPPIGGGPTNTPNPTNTPQPTTTTTGNPNSCNGSCGSDANCASGLTCYTGFCRNPNNPSDTNCTSKSTNPTPTPVTSLPSSGAVEYTWALGIAGILLLGFGGLLAL